MRVKTHPGQVLREEYMIPLGLSARHVAEAIGVPASRVTEIGRERRGVTADTAVRRYFGTTPLFWFNLQVAHDLSVAEASGSYGSIKRRA